MKTIKDFTPEIKAKIQGYKNVAVENLYNGNEYKNWNRKDTVEYIEYIYNLGKQKEKPVVIVANTPNQYKLYYNLLFNNKFNKKYTKLVNLIFNKKNNNELYSDLSMDLNNELYSELGGELYSELGGELRNELRNELGGELRNELYSELSGELYSELGGELYSELGNELRNELRNELSGELYSELYNELRNELRGELRNELRNELGIELYNELRNELGIELYNELRNELDIELSGIRYHYLFLASEYARVYLMWYKFIKDEFNLPTKKAKELDWLYDNVNKANISKVFLCKRVCLVLRMPEKIIRNEQFIHNVNGPAITYPDQDMFYIQGIRVSKELFDRLSNKEYTFDEWIKEENEEIKSAVLGFYQDKFGDTFVYHFLKENLKEVDTYIDKKADEYMEGTTKGMNIGVYTLYKGDINGEEIAYVSCYCPSTDRMFFLGVSPDNTNAKDAIASLYQVPTILKDKIISISRQGEKFSTIFDEETTNKLLKNKYSAEELSSYTHISGDKYFKLMQYEF